MKVRDTVSKSSMESFSLCENKYYIEGILGYRGEGGLKADIGSAVHAVMEYMALIKKKEQEQGWQPMYEHEPMIDIYNDELGHFAVSKSEWEEVRTLSSEEIDKINKGRINKSTYVDQKYLPYDTVRRAEKVIARLSALAQAKYLDKFSPKPCDIRDYNNYIWMVLEQLDIFSVNVVAVELDFDMELPYEWAKKDDGNYVRMKGFIDLVLENTPGVIEIFDYKTGQRKELLKDDKKTYKDIKSDLQLAMYTYVINQLYPGKTVAASLLYVRDGGLFTVCSEPHENEDYVLYEIRRHIETVKNCESPRLLDENRQHFVCKFLCGAAKNKTFSQDICDCQFIKSSIKEIGYEKVEASYKKEKFNV